MVTYLLITSVETCVCHAIYHEWKNAHRDFRVSIRNNTIFFYRTMQVLIPTLLFNSTYSTIFSISQNLKLNGRIRNLLLRLHHLVAAEVFVLIRPFLLFFFISSQAKDQSSGGAHSKGFTKEEKTEQKKVWSTNKKWLYFIRNLVIA